MSRHRRRAGISLLAALLLAARIAGADVFVRDDIITDPTPGMFSVCHGTTCTVVTQVALDESQWQRIAEVFALEAADAQEERARIAEAIARFETVVGVITDTSDDRPENQRAKGKGWWTQMDCIDESTNTTTYLRILVKAGLLRWHRVENRVTRGWFLRGWPHTTAVVSEVKTGARWVVDSWFFENGKPPVIVPLDLWKTGWRPATPRTQAVSQ